MSIQTTTMKSTTKPIRSKLGETKPTLNIKYSNPNEIMKQYADVLKITRTNNQEEEAELAKDALSTKNLFIIENFAELSDGNDDRIASQSDDYHEQEDTSKDVGSTNVFLKLIQELNSIGSLQSVLAISTINQSIDFTSSKFRQTFIAQSGIVSLIKTLQCMVTEPIDLDTRKDYILQNLQRVEPKVGFEILTIMCTLAESGLESRRQLIQEDIIKVAVSLAKISFAPSYSQTHLFKAKVYRLLAACLQVSSARNFVRRIQAIPVFIKQFRQAVKEYAEKKSTECATLICAISQTIESLLKSKRCKEVLIKQQVVSMLIESLNVLPPQIPVSEDLIAQTGQNKRNISIADMLMESLANNLKMIATVQRGRTDILQANGIRKICDMLIASRSTKVIQRAVAVLASCAQDSGVDQAVRKAKGLTVLSNQLSSNDFQTLEAICKTIVAVCRSGPFFGSKDTCLQNKEFLAFNKRNEENIVDLCQQDTVNALGRLIDQPKEVLANAENSGQDAVIVAQIGDKLVKCNESRNLCLLATNALIPLLSSKRGRDTLRQNGGLQKALVDHLSVGDIEVLIATLHAIYTACQNDIECAKMFSIQDHKNSKNQKLSTAVKAMYSLLQHKNVQVVTAAAMALNPICRDGRAFMIGREIPSALIQTSKLLLKEDYDFERDEFYLPYLVKEQKGWLMGIIAELANDVENAKAFSQYNVLDIVCKLCKEHAKPQSFDDNTKPYIFHIDQLVKEKSALALASLSKVPMNMVRVAELETVPALVRCIQTPDGVSVINFSEKQLFIGTQLRNCANPFGSAVNFSLENQVRRKEDKKKKQQQKKDKSESTGADVDVDKDPQQTANPYSLVNNAACKAMAELSKNKRCALLLRQYGAIYGLLTLAGSDEADTQESAAKAIQNIRLQHLTAMDLYKKRQESELEYTEEKCGQKLADNIVYKDRVDAAIQQVFGDRNDTSNQLIQTTVMQQNLASMGSFASLKKRNSTLSMLKRNDTADRIHDMNDIEETRDDLFNKRSQIKNQQNAQTFTSCVGILKHPEVEEPIDVDQVAKEATVATIDAFLKKQVVEEVLNDQQLSLNEQQKRLKPVIKQKPSRAAEPLGWKNPASESERQIGEVYKRFGKDTIGYSEVQQTVDLLKIANVDELFVKGLIKLHDSDKDGAIDESQFIEVYKQLQSVGKLGSKDYYEQIFHVMDYMRDEKILPDVLAQFASKLGVNVPIVQDIILKREFKQKVPSEIIVAFYGKDVSEEEKKEEVHVQQYEQLQQEQSQRQEQPAEPSTQQVEQPAEPSAQQQEEHSAEQQIQQELQQQQLEQQPAEE